MKSHHHGDETKVSVFFTCKDYIAAREASRSGPEPNPCGYIGQTQSYGPKLKVLVPPLYPTQIYLEKISLSKVLPHRIRRRRPVEGRGSGASARAGDGVVTGWRRCGGECEAAKFRIRECKGEVAGVKKRRHGIL